MMFPGGDLEKYSEVLFCDENLIALNKHHGVPVIPERGAHPHTSLHEMAQHVFEQKLFVVHRIDRDTSGVLLLCRNAATHRTLSIQFERKKVKKEYLALLEGTVTGTGTVDQPLFQFGSGRMGIHEKGKPSQTGFVVLENFNGATLVKALPFTGRRHQIRVHFYHLGNPIMGDRLYGEVRPVGGVERMMLHAASLSCRYPGNEEFSVTAPVDDQWKNIIQKFQ